VNDKRITDRVDGPSAGGPAADHAEPAERPEMPADDEGQRERLLVVTLAQRTAEEHIADAHQQADRIHAQAQTMAEQIVRDAQARAAAEVQEAEEARTQARATAEQMARDAQAQADQARRTADTIVSEARARAEQIAADARAQAAELDDRAQLRHEDFVGGLTVTQEAVQRQIQALEQYDRDYRARLVTFMQAQLHALAVDADHVARIEQPRAAAAGDSPPRPQPGSTATIDDTADTTNRPGSNNRDVHRTADRRGGQPLKPSR